MRVVFLSQESYIRKLELQDRLDFYAIILLNVDFDAESVDSFVQLVKADASALTSCTNESTDSASKSTFNSIMA